MPALDMHWLRPCQLQPLLAFQLFGRFPFFEVLLVLSGFYFVSKLEVLGFGNRFQYK